MTLLILGDPLSTLHPEKDTTLGMLMAAQQLGIPVHYATPSDVSLAQSPHHALRVRAAPVAASSKGMVGEPFPIDTYSVALLRYDPPVNPRYRAITQWMDIASTQFGIHVRNAPASLLRFNEKLLIFQFPEWITDTLVSFKTDDLLHFIDEQKKVVLKPLDGMAGRGIMVTSCDDSNRFALLELLTKNEQRAILAQRFLPGITEHGDRRILLVHHALPQHALVRRPKLGEHRANLAAGGSGIAEPLTPREQSLAEALIAFTRAHGLDFVGLDVIDGYLTEVNITSPTGARQIAAQTGEDLCLNYIQGFIQEGRLTPCPKISTP